MNGKNNADLAPTTTLVLPSIIDFHIFIFSLTFTSECQSNGFVLNLFLNLSNHCAVIEISGKRTKTCFFLDIHLLIASKYTSVLPDPATPSITTVKNFL